MVKHFNVDKDETILESHTIQFLIIFLVFEMALFCWIVAIISRISILRLATRLDESFSGINLVWV